MQHARLSAQPATVESESATGLAGAAFFDHQDLGAVEATPMAEKRDVSGLAHWAEEPDEKRRGRHRDAHAHGNAPPPAAHGLHSYQVVANGQVPGANQLTVAQRATLDQYAFGAMNVVGDKDRGHGHMTQTQYGQLQSAFLNIASGQSMQLGGTAADQGTFLNMLRDSSEASPQMRRLVSDIGNDRNPAHRFQANVGRSQPGLLGDSFRTQQIDLDDLSTFASDPKGNEVGQTEMLAHILAERRYASLVHARLPDGTTEPTFDPTTADFNPAHDYAITVQNAIRDERHAPTHIAAQTLLPHGPFFGGGADLQIQLSGGTSQIVRTNSVNDITGGTLPPNKTRR